MPIKRMKLEVWVDVEWHEIHGATIYFDGMDITAEVIRQKSYDELDEIFDQVQPVQKSSDHAYDNKKDLERERTG